MKFKSVLLVVRDLEASKRFYREVLGLRVVEDFGANVTLTGGIALQTLESWKILIFNNPDLAVTFKHHAGELYFEEDNIQAFSKKLQSMNGIEYAKKLHELPWGQFGISLYDPDGNVLDIGENMRVVVKRFLDSGMSIAQIAVRMDIPEQSVRFYGRERGVRGKK